MTLDTLSIPAMSMECERVFSSAKKLLTPARDNLSDWLEPARLLDNRASHMHLSLA